MADHNSDNSIDKAMKNNKDPLPPPSHPRAATAALLVGVAEARRGLREIMISKFSSTPLQETEYTVYDEIELRKQLAEDREDHNDCLLTATAAQGHTGHNDAAVVAVAGGALTWSEREYLSALLRSGDVSSMESASAVLRDDRLFPHSPACLDEVDSSGSSTASGSTGSGSSAAEGGGTSKNVGGDHGKISIATTADAEVSHPSVEQRRRTRIEQEKQHQQQHRRGTLPAAAQERDHAGATADSGGGTTSRVRVQRELFRLHESEQSRHLRPSQLVQRLNFVHKNSILSQATSSSGIDFFGSGGGTPERTATGAASADQQHNVDFSLRQSSFLSYTEDELRQQPSQTMDCWSTTEEPLTETMPPPITMTTDDEEHSTVTNFVVVNVNNDPLATTAAASFSLSWNPFEDVSSWLDNSQGVEVSGDGTPQIPRDHGDDDDNTNHNHHEGLMNGMSSAAAAAAVIGESVTDTNFRILGTTADDASCHPHVLSPPLMESLLAFIPEEYQQQQQQQQKEPAAAALPNQPAQPPRPLNLWLKYSLARDGPTMWAFLRQVRASTLCILAIETDDGHVLGSFTSQPWRLSKGWYGGGGDGVGEDAFVWRLRRSRLDSAGQSIVDQVNHESEIQVFPYRSTSSNTSGGGGDKSNNTRSPPAIQYCSKKCLRMGRGEVLESSTVATTATDQRQHDDVASHQPPSPAPTKPKMFQKHKRFGGGRHYGHALSLDKDLKHGTTSSSETFGNPCLIDPTQRGTRFTVANIEVWAVTPHVTVAEAEQAELSNLFLDVDNNDDGRDPPTPPQARRLNHFMNVLVGGPV